MLHSAPQARFAHGSGAEQLNVPSPMQRPSGLHAFTSAVSAQSVSPGAHAVHASPQRFPAHGSYGSFPHPSLVEAATASSARSDMARRMT
jgi:hypothetical protein